MLSFEDTPMHTKRREVLRHGFALMGLLMTGPVLLSCHGDETSPPLLTDRSLQEPDENGLRLPLGVTSRIVARTGQEPGGTIGYPWHPAPDGGATFSTLNGGWIYVSNSEMSNGTGGVGALRFDAQGNLVAAYPILQGTNRNCAGGPTPWGTWLSCEEVSSGRVFECDPLGIRPAVERPTLGLFNHEGVAVDPLNHQLYLTEDALLGRFYRFTPDALTGSGFADLSAGRLEAARVVLGLEGAVVWEPIPDPSGSTTPTRDQAPNSTPFAGGEGIWYFNGIVYFTTKLDNRVWAYNIAASSISIIYDIATSPTPTLSGVDNVTVSPSGEVLVAEDGGDMQIVAITPSGEILPIMQVANHPNSEVTGPAFDPSGTRLYFSSQRGAAGTSSDGVTYEISGPISM